MKKRRKEIFYELSVRSRFSAAHLLRGYSGKCGRFHGHNWEVEVFVRGNCLDKAGMVIDFGMLKDVVRKVLNKFDHSDLLELPEFTHDNPTSENIARVLFHAIRSEMPAGPFCLSRVVVRETPDSAAAYCEEEQ